MSAAAATDLVRRMVHKESRGPGDIDNAMQRIEQRYGLPFWSLWHLRKGKAKTCDIALFSRIRAAYLDMCAGQLSKLHAEIQTEIAIEKATTGDDTLADLELQVRILAEKIVQARAALK